jgi:hypothetical protein
MSIASAITRFRARQAEQFSDEVIVSRAVGDLETDSTTGAVTQPYDEVYEGVCKIRPAGRSADDVSAGDTELRLVDMLGKFPVDTDLRKDDIVTVAASTYDASMVTRQYRITEVPADAWQIARVVGLEETLVPALNPESS